MSRRSLSEAVRTFQLGVAALAWPWRGLVGLQTLLNGLVPIAFLPAPEAQATLTVFAINCAVTLVIVSRTGFSRLIGLGHLLWLPLGVWMGTRLHLMSTFDTLYAWACATLLINGFSLTIDAADIARYLRGERDDRQASDDLG